MISFRRVFALVSLGSVLLFGSAARADDLEAALDTEIGIPTTVVVTTTPETAPTSHRDPSTVGALSERHARRVQLPNSDAERSTLVVTTTQFRRHHRRHDRRVASR